MTSLGEIQFYVYGINMIFGKNFKKILIAFLVFLFAFQAVSIIFSLYWRLPWIDNFTHFLGGATAGMGMIWWTFYSAKISPMTKSLPKIYIFVIILGFVALVGVFWEIYELIVDRLVTKNNYISILQSGGLIDTMKDLFVDLLGGSAVIWLFFKERKKQQHYEN
ncbi:MAG: hypothetical protein AAB924_01630 [Patescibacteria group bacterium]